MRRTDLKFDRLCWVNLAALTAVVILTAGCFALTANAQQSGQKTFSSPEAASEALFTAARNNDEKAMLDILGDEAKQIVSSGDEAEDTESRANFVQKYQQMHRLVNEPDGTTTLYIGAENWPTPIPLVSKDHSWYFDTEAGEEQILFRRVGRNEVSAIRICQELVAAQKEYFSAQHHHYSARMLSAEGQHDGLYWKTAAGERESPIGPLLAQAVPNDGKVQNPNGAPTPFRGYFFRLMTRQGKNCPDGAKNYIVDGKMTGGFAFVAYPAEYGSSGVMTFVVNQEGVVYQKDLGKKTEAHGREMKEYNPDSTWQIADELPGEEIAGGK
jgi:hypothetical protein